MSTLQSVIEGLAHQFVTALLEALRTLPIAELGMSTQAPKEPTKRPKAEKSTSERLARRSPEQIKELLQKIQVLLVKNPDGLRTEHIRDALGIPTKELHRPLAEGIAARHLVKSGDKRATVYRLSPGRKSAATKEAAKKAALKAATKAASKTAPKPAAKKTAKMLPEKI